MRAARWQISVVAILALCPDRRSPVAQPLSYEVAPFCTSAARDERRQVRVSNGAELQAALDTAAGGDTILLDASSTFRPVAPEGSFVLRRRELAADAWVTMRSADKAFDADGALPPSTRVDKADANVMPKIRAASNRPALKSESGARGYRLIGIDIGIDPHVVQVTNLVELGSGHDAAIETEPSDIVIDRCYLHGNDVGNARRGVAMNGVRLAVVESYLENFHDLNGDSQAIAGWNGPGPFKIVNNVLEAAGENVMFGGADPAIHDLVPADIEIRRNLVTKRLAWRTAGVPVKNAFELKNARRVIVDGNTFENVWRSGQDGTAIVLKSVNQEGRCSWCVTEYVTFSNNVVRNAANALIINAAEAGARGAPPPLHVNHIRVHNVLFQNIGGPDWLGGGKLLRIMGGVSDVAITHITSGSNPTGILDPRDAGDLNPRFVFQYNIVERKLYGIGAGQDEGERTLTRNFAPFSYRDNVLVNTSHDTSQGITDDALKARYPATTMIAAAWEAMAFQKGTYKLAATSPFSRRGDNGRDLGVNLDALVHAQQASDSSGCGPRR